MTNLKINNTHRLAMSVSPLALFLTLTACPPGTPVAPPSVFNADARLVFPRTTQSITVDGVGPVVAAAGDAAWTDDSFKFELEQGGPSSSATMRGVSTDTDLYLYFEAEDPSFDFSDAVVVALNPTGADPNYHRFVIAPCAAVCPGQPTPNPVPLNPGITYFTGSKSGAAVTWTAGATPAGIEIKSASAAGSPNIWSVEMKIPRTALGGFNENWMGLFADAIVVDENAGANGEALQYSWPTGLALTGELDTPGGNGTVDVAQWGNATLSTAFGNGVSVSYHEFGSNQTDPTAIALNGPNSFHAYAINNSSNAGGTLVEAKNVSATFQVINNGLGGGWPNIPVAGNPSGPVNIPAASAHLFETGIWNLTAQQISDYTANPNQCVQVTLSTTDAGTVIAQPTARKNMHFVNVNSPFEAVANLSMAGFEKFAGNDRPAFVLREYFNNLDEGMKWNTRLSGAEQIGPGKWLAALQPRSDGKLGVWVSPDDRLRLPNQRFQIAPGTGGPNAKSVDIPVDAGSIVTLIADGSLILGDVQVSAGGITPLAVRLGEKGTLDRGKVAEGRPDRFGALLGSFDNFQTHFVIGNGTTVKVPNGASNLSVMINDGEGSHDKQRGKGFSLQVIPSKITRAMLRQYPELGREVKGRNVIVPLGANLPSWVVRGEIVTNNFITIKGKRYRVHMPAGSFGYWIRSVGESQIGPVRPGRPDLGSIRTDIGVIRPDATIRRGGDVN